MKLCQPENSHFLMLANATLGTFFKVMDKPREAIQFLQNVVKVPGILYGILIIFFPFFKTF